MRERDVVQKAQQAEEKIVFESLILFKEQGLVCLVLTHSSLNYDLNKIVLETKSQEGSSNSVLWETTNRHQSGMRIVHVPLQRSMLLQCLPCLL